jgi:hypothetical protein
MFENFRRERQIRKALRAVARQRVAMILQPGNVMVVELSPPDEEWFHEAMQTSLLRGWVAVLYDGVPHGEIGMVAGRPQLPQSGKPKTMFRLTEAGWATLNRSHEWVLATFAVATATLIATIGALIITLLPKL